MRGLAELLFVRLEKLCEQFAAPAATRATRGAVRRINAPDRPVTMSASFRGLAAASRLLLLQLCLSGPASAQVSYPFELPAEIEATLVVDTTRSAPINHMLLGLNCNWPEGLYGKTGYNNPKAQKVIRAFQPTSLRFPHGVWANFYDWESDGRRMTDNYSTPYDSAVKNHADLKYGFDGFSALHRELGFDVLFTWNVNYDSPEKGVRRLIDRRNKGFDVKWIELGNEIFWKTQRSEAVRDVDRYIAVSRAHAAALREVAPRVLLSVPVHWRNALTDPWNLALREHDYYDAVTLHKHISKADDRKGAAEILNVKREMVEAGEDLRQVFPGRPIWVSEWSVSCGDNALSILGMADTYLGFFEHPDLFLIADYFQLNASHALIEYDKQADVHRLTSYGAAYDIVRGVFEGSEMYESHIDSTRLDGGLDAVSAKAVVREGEVTVFAINKTPRHVPLSVTFDGAADTRPVLHRALSFADVNELKSFGLGERVLADFGPDRRSATGAILLPPLSINRIDREHER